MTNNAYNIFYTDDDADDQEVFREIVAEINEDIYIFTQNNGAELMDLLDNPPPRAHVVFLDLNMPVKNGYEVLKEIRQVKRMDYLPVIIFSTSNEEDNIMRTKSLGGTMYITKPGSYNELKDILRHVLAIDWKHYDSEKDYVYEAGNHV